MSDPKSGALVANLGNVLCDTLEEKNAWKKRMLTAGGCSFPSDFDALTEEEKAERLDKAIEAGMPTLKKGKPNE